MVHIGIDARLTGYRIGGISTYIERLIDAFEVQAAAHQITIFDSYKSNRIKSSQFGYARLFTPPHHRFERLSLSVELLRFNLDVLHSPDFIPPLRGAKKHVITVHDLTFLHFPQHKDRGAQRYYNEQIQMAVRQADHILSVSEATKSDLITMLHVPESKITVQPHGVDNRFAPLSPGILEKSRQKLNLPETFILFVGTLEPRKNIPALLDAYQQLKNVPPLLLVGHPGWLFDDTMQRIQQMQADGVPIIIRSDITDNALPAVYNMASLLVMPSLYEGFGLPVLEAMACGTPVIASNNSSLPEVLGDAGLLIDSQSIDPEIIQYALENTEWRQQARLKGQQRAKQFTWERSAQIALSVYQSVI